jgi:hypothetical protein
MFLNMSYEYIAYRIYSEVWFLVDAHTHRQWAAVMFAAYFCYLRYDYIMIWTRCYEFKNSKSVSGWNLSTSFTFNESIILFSY